MSAGRARTWVIGGTGLALATLVPVALYQLRAIRRLPDPPGELFDSEHIVMSPQAHPVGVPDALLGISSYSVTLALALLADQRPSARTLLGFKLAGDGAAAGFNAVRQVVSFRRVCSWCTGTALATLLMVAGGRSFVRGSVEDIQRLLGG